MKRITLLLCLAFFSVATFANEKTRLITFNIRYDNSGDGDASWSHRKDGVVSLLRFHNPDLFCVQEALHNQMEDLSDGLESYDHIGVGREDGKEKGEYSAIFYKKERYKLEDHGQFWLSETPDKPVLGWDAVCVRICTWGKFKDSETGKEFFVFNTHTDHVGKVAERESVTLIANKIKEITHNKYPVMITGDFNITPETEPIQKMKGLFSEAGDVSKTPVYGPIGTFNDFKFTNELKDKIDYIFVSHKVNVIRYGTLSDSKDQHYYSDHLPVMTDVMF